MFKNDKRFEVKKSEGLIYEMSIIVDKETGVNYLFTTSGHAGGLTPLLNSDGTPVVTKNFDNE